MTAQIFIWFVCFPFSPLLTPNCPDDENCLKERSKYCQIMGLLHGLSYVSTDADIEMNPVQGVEWWPQELLSCRLSEDLHLLCQRGDSGAFQESPCEPEGRLHSKCCRSSQCVLCGTRHGVQVNMRFI